MKYKIVLGIFLLVGVSLVATIVLSEVNQQAMPNNLLKKYEANYEQFKQIEIGDKIVYFYQRRIEDAIVEKDFIVYQFDKNTNELLAQKTQWRDDLPEYLPQIMITKEQAESMVKGEVRFSTLLYISPQSDVFSIRPTPKNPCWIVRNIEKGNMIVTIIDAVEGSILGNGIPPPYTAFSLSGPVVFNPCGYSWTAWYENATWWFNTMGYSTEAVLWPTEEKVKSHIQSSETAVFYEIAHSGGLSTQFKSGCLNGNDPEYTYASEIETWIVDYQKMPFTFLASCFSMCDTTDNTLSYEFRKGSNENTVTIGYCNMSEEECSDCWSYSLVWQDTMFFYMNQGYTVKYAFDQANAHYPVCAVPKCMRFAGDENLAVVPTVAREPVECGETITEHKTLHNDLLNCSGQGLIIGADNITLDCNGHLIDGDNMGVDYGIYLSNRENVTIKNCMIQEFERGIYLDSSSNNILTGNTVNNNNYGAYLGSSQYNTFWDNIFKNNSTNAYEEATANNNNWNLGQIGNYWSDFENNPGYPDYYEIPGPGDGVDYHPLLDSDSDGIVDHKDNCPNDYNPEQNDTDQDGIGDACDNCPAISNLSQEDDDSDEVGDACDNCWYVQNPKQDDSNDNCPAPPYESDPECGDACEYTCGDIDNDGDVDIVDNVCLINYLFRSGPPPECPPFPYTACADTNGDGEVNILDVVYLINYLFKSGPEPIC